MKDSPTLQWAADDDSYYLLCMTGTPAALVSYPLSEVSCSWLCVCPAPWNELAAAGWDFVKSCIGFGY